jgi:hypothetical protein
MQHVWGMHRAHLTLLWLQANSPRTWRKPRPHTWPLLQHRSTRHVPTIIGANQMTIAQRGSVHEETVPQDAC